MTSATSEAKSAADALVYLRNLCGLFLDGQDQSAEEIIAAGFPEADVLRVARLVDINEYKRRQAPPGIKISHRAFGRDRRYPITNGFGRK